MLEWSQGGTSEMSPPIVGITANLRSHESKDSQTGLWTCDLLTQQSMPLPPNSWYSFLSLFCIGIVGRRWGRENGLCFWPMSSEPRQRGLLPAAPTAPAWVDSGCLLRLRACPRKASGDLQSTRMAHENVKGILKYSSDCLAPVQRMTGVQYFCIGDYRTKKKKKKKVSYSSMMLWEHLYHVFAGSLQTKNPAGWQGHNSEKSLRAFSFQG